MSKNKTILVIFENKLPKKSKKWWRQFDEIIGPKELENLISPSSVQQAYELVNKVSRLTLADGSRLSKLIKYQGYELWWVHYDDIYYNFCLPYTQYHRLLEYLRDFNKIYLFQAPQPELFQYFLKAYDRQCIIFSQFRFRNLLPIPFGLFIQCLFSLGFLLWLKIAKPRLIIQTSDKFDRPHDFDFRQKFFYKELRSQSIPFVEFIRSFQPWHTVLQHAWQRKRAVVYSAAIIEILHSFTRQFGHFSLSFSESNPEKRFWFLVATHYFCNIKGTIWSIRVMKFILQWIGVKAAIIPAGTNRTFHEILGCKLAGIKAIGIQYGAISRYYVVSDFMPEFDGKNPLSLDKYGLWSDWWKDYYLKHSHAFKPEQLYVSGSIRPLEKEIAPTELSLFKNRPLKVLFISEQLANPKEVMPYLLALLGVKDFALSLKIRPQVDGFVDWLKKNEPGVLERVKVLKGNIHEAISEFDVVVGSHSTAALEGLAQLKPFVFFWTDKWGDYFDVKSFDHQDRFFAENPEELIERIRKSIDVPKETLKRLQKQFFGNPYQNGSKWVVEQAIEYSKIMTENKSFKILLVCPNIPGMLVLPGAIGIFTAILKKAGFELDLFDATLYETEVSVSPEKRADYLQARKFSYKQDLGIKLRSDLIGSFQAKIDSFKPNLLVFSVVEDAFKQAVSLLDVVKDRKIPHIIGGVFPTAAPEKVIAYPQIKIIGVGEGEGAVLELAERLRDGRQIDDIPNTWVKKDDGTIIKNTLGPLVDINKIFPDYSLFEEIRFYRPMGGKILKTIPLETCRGCPYQCAFCNSPMWTKFYHEQSGAIFLRRKSIDTLMEEIRYLVKQYKPELLYIIDDTFLARPIEEIREFAKRYQEFKIPFWMNTRPETITREKIDLLKEMNCYRMSIGVECGSEEFRKSKLKRFGSNKEILKNMDILSGSGLVFSINNMIGFPDETRELIFETIELNRQFSGYDSITVSIFTPYHGAQLREEAVQKGYLDSETITTHTTSSSLLRMPQLGVEEIDGLIRTFTMYVGFPKKWWPHIEKAEKLTPEGNAMFEKLKEIYHNVFFSGNQFSKPKEVPHWDTLEKQIL